MPIPHSQARTAHWRCSTVRHPAIADGSIRHWPDWAQDVEMFSVHWGAANALGLWCFIQKSARISTMPQPGLIDRACRRVCAGPQCGICWIGVRTKRPALTTLRTIRMMQFASGASLTLDGDLKTERWRRIEIIDTSWATGGRPSEVEAHDEPGRVRQRAFVSDCTPWCGSRRGGAPATARIRRRRIVDIELAPPLAVEVWFETSLSTDADIPAERTSAEAGAARNERAPPV